jgi:hypothetical protein
LSGLLDAGLASPRRKEMKYVLGTVSEGKLNQTDLIEAFSETLECILKDKESYDPSYDRLIYECREAIYDSYEDIHEFVDELMNALDDFSPPYCYFGAHESDPACFGFWFNEEMFNGIKVNDLAEIPDDYEGDVLVGGCDLYNKQKGKEPNMIWSIA